MYIYRSRLSGLLAEQTPLNTCEGPGQERAGPPPDSTSARFVPAHSNRWCSFQNQPNSDTCRPITTWPRRICRVVIHTLAGLGTRTESAAQRQIRAWVAQPTGEGKSAHYIIDRDGAITQMVREANVAFHARPYNQNSIGIEHADICNDSAPYTTLLYERSAALVREIASFHGFAIKVFGIDTNNIQEATVIGHSDLVPGHHSDPGPYWDWEYYRRLLLWDGRTPSTRPIRLVAMAASSPRPPSGWAAAGRRQIANAFCAGPRDPYGSRFWRTRPSASGTPAMLSVNLPEAGLYKVSLWWPRVAGANPAAPVDIQVVSPFSPSSQSITVDQRTRFGRWNDVGAQLTVTMVPARVDVFIRRDTERVRRGERDTGFILADAMRLLRIA